MSGVKKIFYEGQAYKVSELSQLTNLSRSQIDTRIKKGLLVLYNPEIHRLSSEINNSFQTKREGRVNYVFIDNEWLTWNEISAKYNIPHTTLRSYIKKGVLQAHIRYKNVIYELKGESISNNNRIKLFRYEIKNGESNQPLNLPRSEIEMYTGVQKIFKTISNQIPQGSNIYLVLHFITPNDRIVETRQIMWSNDVNELMRKVYLLNDGGNVNGSDGIPNNYVLDYSRFSFKVFVRNQAGGSKDNKKRVTSPLFIMYSYGGDAVNNNCLFYIIVRCSMEYNRMQAKTLRQKCNIQHNGPIQASKDDMDIIETSLGVGFIIYSDVGEIIYSTNQTKPDHKFTTVIECCLQDGHYYHIQHKKSDYVETRGGDRRSRINLAKISDNDEITIKTEEDQIEEHQEKVDKKPNLRVFYDLETVYDSKDNNYFKCYSVAWKCCNEQKVYLEYDSINDNSTSFTCLRKFASWLISKSKEWQITLIGFNSSKFDNFLLNEELDYHDLIYDVVYVNNSVLDIRSSIGLKYFDLRRYIPSSLLQACKDFKTKNIKVEGFSHEEPQNAYEFGCLGLWIEENKEKFEKYCKMDVVCLEELFTIVNNSVKELTTLEVEGVKECSRITDAATIGQLAYRYWKKTCDEKIVCCKTKQEDDCHRKSMYGGRTQCFLGKQKLEGKPMVLVDVKSLYPYAGLIGEYPIGESVKTEKYIPSKLGIYKCKILKRENYPMIAKDGYGNERRLPNIIPFRSEDETPLNWDYEGEMDCVLTSVDIQMLKKYGWEVEIHEGEFWNKSSNTVFKNYISKFMDEKNKQDSLKGTEKYNAGIREMCKLFLNCLLGKIMQRNFEDGYVLCRNNKQIDKFLSKVKFESVEVHNIGLKLMYMKGKLINNIVKPKPAHLGTFMYSYARKHMYDNIFSKEMVYYSDTDCALIEKSVYERLKVENELFSQKKTEFGVFELEEVKGEKEFNGALLIAPKTYCLYNLDPIKGSKCALKFRAKGVSLKDDYANSGEDVKTLMYDGKVKKNLMTLEWIKGWMPDHFEDFRPEVDLEYFDEEYFRSAKKGKVGSVEFFEELYEGKPITVLTTIFKRGVKKEGDNWSFNLKLVENTKEFKI